MSRLRLFFRATREAINACCRPRLLPGLLLVLCLVLSLAAAPTAEQLLTGGVSFSGITLGITAPEGDGTPALLSEYLGKMQDLRQYCAIVPLNAADAEQSLQDGQVTAVLALPENFVSAVRRGENPPVSLLVRRDRPLDALLTLWVGQSAADLLQTVQRGVYQVQTGAETAGLSSGAQEDALQTVNLRYIQWVAGRSAAFREVRLSPVDTLPLAQHYGITLTAYLTLCAALITGRLYDRQRLARLSRSRSVGRGSGCFFLGAVSASTLLLTLLTLPPLWAICGALSPALFARALLWALFCAALAAVLFLLLPGQSAGGTALFFLALAALVAAGGILPPSLLPAWLQNLSFLSPASWLQSHGAQLMGLPADPLNLRLLPMVTAILLILAAGLYAARFAGREAGE